MKLLLRILTALVLAYAIPGALFALWLVAHGADVRGAAIAGVLWPAYLLMVWAIW